MLAQRFIASDNDVSLNMPTNIPKAAVTIAVCINCGAEKDSPLGPCPDCAFIPRSNIEKTHSLLLSSEFSTLANLTKNSLLIRDGQPVDLDNELAAAILETTRGPNRPQFTSGIPIAIALLVLISILTVILIVVDGRLANAIFASILAVTIPLACATWADILAPLCRRCNSCNARGVTQGSAVLFYSSKSYDKWRFCTICREVHLRTDGKWVRRDPSEAA